MKKLREAFHSRPIEEWEPYMGHGNRVLGGDPATPFEVSLKRWTGPAKRQKWTKTLWMLRDGSSLSHKAPSCPGP